MRQTLRYFNFNTISKSYYIHMYRYFDKFSSIISINNVNHEGEGGPKTSIKFRKSTLIAHKKRGSVKNIDE